MGLQATKEAYELAKSLYIEIRDGFNTIENDPSNDDKEMLMVQTLKDIAKLNKVIPKINIEDLEGAFPKNIETLKKNIETFKEAAYFLEKKISTMRLFDKLNPILPQYLKEVEWKNIGDTIDKASIALSNYLTNDYTQYKIIIQNIIKGTFTPKSFKALFDSVSPRIKPKRIKKRTTEFESFISLSSYKKLFESLAYSCQTCGERAEHEEIEENPDMKCSNCGDSNWEQEY